MQPSGTCVFVYHSIFRPHKHCSAQYKNVLIMEIGIYKSLHWHAYSWISCLLYIHYCLAVCWQWSAQALKDRSSEVLLNLHIVYLFHHKASHMWPQLDITHYSFIPLNMLVVRGMYFWEWKLQVQLVSHTKCISYGYSSIWLTSRQSNNKFKSLFIFYRA